MALPTTIKQAIDFLVARVKDIEDAGGGSHPDLAAHDTLGLATDTELTAHTGDTTDAHDASAISVVPFGGIAATNVQEALEEIVTESGAATDHGTLSGLTDDDHTQYQKESEKGAADGYASLGADSLVPQDQLGTGTQTGAKFLRDDGTWQTVSGGGGGSEPWQGVLHVAFGDGNPTGPHVLWGFQFTAASVSGPTPTQIGTAVGRLVMFRFAAAITVQNIRYHCNTGNNNNIHTFAIYNADTSARVWTATVPNAGSGWNVIALGGSPFVLDADTPYWFGIGANTTSAVSCFRSPAGSVAGSLGVTTIPGSLAAYAARYGQVALTAGAWPDPLPTLATAAFGEAGNGTVPIVFLDAA